MLPSNWPNARFWTLKQPTNLFTRKTLIMATDRKYVKAKHDTTSHRNRYTTHDTKGPIYYRTSNSLLQTQTHVYRYTTHDTKGPIYHKTNNSLLQTQIHLFPSLNTSKLENTPPVATSFSRDTILRFYWYPMDMKTPTSVSHSKNKWQAF